MIFWPKNEDQTLIWNSTASRLDVVLSYILSERMKVRYKDSYISFSSLCKESGVQCVEDYTTKVLHPPTHTHTHTTHTHTYTHTNTHTYHSIHIHRLNRWHLYYSIPNYANRLKSKSITRCGIFSVKQLAWFPVSMHQPLMSKEIWIILGWVIFIFQFNFRGSFEKIWNIHIFQVIQVLVMVFIDPLVITETKEKFLAFGRHLTEYLHENVTKNEEFQVFGWKAMPLEIWKIP